VTVCGVGVDPLRPGEVLAAIARAVDARRAGLLARPLRVVSVNVDMIARAARDPGLAADLAAADLALADGVPVLWMARALGGALPGRVAGSDLVPLLAARCAARGDRLFLLGGAPGVAERAAARLRAAAPGLRIAGTLAPPRGALEDPRRRATVAVAVRASGADVVLVALGAPRQERFAAAEGERTGAAALVAVGGALDIAAGDRPRAPRALRGTGLEWAWRLALEPRRLGRRYLVEDAAVLPLFARALAARVRTSGGP
jgi:N-acetylglucosaminyldiphosphoundecaprenol N-acetyl-beta-D-mannosaminyltransferase